MAGAKAAVVASIATAIPTVSFPPPAFTTLIGMRQKLCAMKWTRTNNIIIFIF